MRHPWLHLAVAFYQEMPIDAKKMVDDAWVRLITVGDLRPMAFCETENFQKFQTILSHALGSSCRWLPPKHADQANIIDQHFRRGLEQAASELQTLPAESKPVHVDGWSDRWKRVWVLGTVWWLHTNGNEPWVFKRCAFAFERTSRWSSESAGTQHCAGTAATAVRSAWRQAALGDMPSWGAQTIVMRQLRRRSFWT